LIFSVVGGRLVFFVEGRVFLFWSLCLVVGGDVGVDAAGVRDLLLVLHALPGGTSKPKT
jgi:hypothetical protein